MGTHTIDLDRDRMALRKVMEFDHVIHVDEDGTVTDAEGQYAPDVDVDTDSDGQILDHHEKAMIESVRSQGWELMTGYTGQYCYHGPIMHPSEFIGGRLAEAILEDPGYYVSVSVETDNPEEPAGWAIARKDG